MFKKILRNIPIFENENNGSLSDEQTFDVVVVFVVVAEVDLSSSAAVAPPPPPSSMVLALNIERPSDNC